MTLVREASTERAATAAASAVCSRCTHPAPTSAASDDVSADAADAHEERDDDDDDEQSFAEKLADDDDDDDDDGAPGASWLVLQATACRDTACSATVSLEGDTVDVDDDDDCS